MLNRYHELAKNDPDKLKLYNKKRAEKEKEKRHLNISKKGKNISKGREIAADINKEINCDIECILKEFGDLE